MAKITECNLKLNTSRKLVTDQWLRCRPPLLPKNIPPSLKFVIVDSESYKVIGKRFPHASSKMAITFHRYIYRQNLPANDTPSNKMKRRVLEASHPGNITFQHRKKRFRNSISSLNLAGALRKHNR